MLPQTPRGLFSLLANGEKAVDVVLASREMGLLELLDRGPVTLRELSTALEAKPNRLYKLLDCLETLGLVSREEPGDDVLDARYRVVAPLAPAAEAVFGERSIERDRDKYAWRKLLGRLPDVLRGRASIDEADFSWPPSDDEQVRGFEASMAAGMPPIVESFAQHHDAVFPLGARVLDVGGGDGTLACALARERPDLRVDVLNLPAVAPLVEARFATSEHASRLGFVACDFLAESLPAGYDVVLFVRVLHDWPARTARALLMGARASLSTRGRVVICEELRDPERLAVQFFWTYFLVGVDACTSRLRDAAFYECALVEAGFSPPRRIPGPFDLLVATTRTSGAPR